MLCILYVNAAGALLGIVALLIERALPVTTARRWVWCAAIPLSMALPGFYRSHHAWSVTEVSAQPAAGSPVGSVVQGAMRYVFDPGWWTHAESYNSSINRLWLIASGLPWVRGGGPQTRYRTLIGLYSRGALTAGAFGAG